MFKKIPEEKIVDWIESDRLNEFGKYLVSGSVHGKPGIPLAELTRIEKIISKSLDPEEQYQLGKKLLQRSPPVSGKLSRQLNNQMGCGIG